MTDATDFSAWVGHERTAGDIASRAPLEGLAALLDRPQFQDVVPPLGHWLYFLPRERQSRLGADGHPLHGDFLPPFPYPRRMWAGGRFEFLGPIAIGAPIVRRSRILSIEPKDGRSGPMVFVTIEHEISADGAAAVREEHDIVFRSAQPPVAQTAPAPPLAPDSTEPAEQEKDVMLDSVALFRFSALTFNGHRIHYDRDYARDVEGYPGLVVHGPLLATLLMHFCHDAFDDAKATAFRFRAVRPVFDGKPFKLLGRRSPRGITLRVKDHAGHLAMDAEVTTR